MVRRPSPLKSRQIRDAELVFFFILREFLGVDVHEFGLAQIRDAEFPENIVDDGRGKLDRGVPGDRSGGFKPRKDKRIDVFLKRHAMLEPKTDGNGKTVHDTEKPVELTDILIGNSSNDGDTVFDPFMGIGGCGVSAAKLGRKFIGCELDERYYNIAKNRINEQCNTSK